MFIADYLMKQQALGIRVDGVKPKLRTSEYVWPKELARAGMKPGYKMGKEEDCSHEKGKHNWNRKWIVVKDKVKSFLSDQKYNKSILIGGIRMGIEAREMYTTKEGYLKDKKMQNCNHYAYKWADKMTGLYETACKYFPEYQVLKSMSKAIALAKWMYTKGVKIDLPLIEKIFKRQKLRNWEDKVPSLNKTN